MTLLQISIKILSDNPLRIISTIFSIAMNQRNKISQKMSLPRCLAVTFQCSLKLAQPIMDLYLTKTILSPHFLPNQKRKKMASIKFSKLLPRALKDKARAKLQRKLTHPTSLPRFLDKTILLAAT